MFYGFSFRACIKIFVKVLIEKNVIISNEVNFSDGLLKCKLHWVASKVYMNPFGVHSLCMLPNVETSEK